ncbi:MAG: orotate phosphoribosyltransferase [Acidobacteriota bacterium]
MTSALTPSSDGLNDEILRHLSLSLSLVLWREGAIRVSVDEPFRLASGLLSPIYVNCRQVISVPSFLRLFTAVAGPLLEGAEAEFDAIAGGETAGIPYATALATAVGKPCLYVRKKAKDYGVATRVEGRLEAGWRVLLVEDLITDGGSKIGFLEALRGAGATVSDALVLFDRQQGGAATLAQHGVRLHAATDRTTAFAAASAAGLIDDKARDSVEAYLRDPEAWQPHSGAEGSE